MAARSGPMTRRSERMMLAASRKSEDYSSFVWRPSASSSCRDVLENGGLLDLVIDLAGLSSVRDRASVAIASQAFRAAVARLNRRRPAFLYGPMELPPEVKGEECGSCGAIHEGIVKVSAYKPTKSMACVGLVFGSSRKHAVRFSPSGRLAAAIADGEYGSSGIVWSTVDGLPRQLLRMPTTTRRLGSATAVAFSPDEKFALLLFRRGAFVYPLLPPPVKPGDDDDISDGVPEGPTPCELTLPVSGAGVDASGHQGPGAAPAAGDQDWEGGRDAQADFSACDWGCRAADGAVAAICRGTLHLWSMDGGAGQHLDDWSPPPMAPGSVVSGVRWSPDGTRLAVVVTTPAEGMGGVAQPQLSTLHLCDSPLARLPHPPVVVALQSLVMDIAWSPNGRTIAAATLEANAGRESRPAAVALCDAVTGSPRETLISPGSEGATLCTNCAGAEVAVSISADGRRLFVDTGLGSWVWPLGGGSCVSGAPFRLHRPPPWFDAQDDSAKGKPRRKPCLDNADVAPAMAMSPCGRCALGVVRAFDGDDDFDRYAIDVDAASDAAEAERRTKVDKARAKEAKEAAKEAAKKAAKEAAKAAKRSSAGGSGAAKKRRT